MNTGEAERTDSIPMKRIIVNGRFLTQRLTGVQRYAREILAELDKMTEPGELQIAVPPDAKDLPIYENIEIYKTGHTKGILWENFSFPLCVLRKKGISLNLCNTSPLVSPGVVCVMDMKLRATPQFYKKRFILWYRALFCNSLRRARKIITISEFSKKEICKYYNINPDRISVIPCAWQHFDRISFDEGALTRYGLEKNGYYYSMSSLEPNKNFRWIAEAAKNNPDQIFAVAGAINEKIFADGLGFECPDNVKILGYVTDEEAKTLMRDCKAFVFPTFYEGFGLPPLEAISAGCRNIIVSDTEVMHEVFGNKAVYIDPEKADHHVFVDETGKNTGSEEVLNKYSWHSSAAQLKNILDEV